MNQTSKAQQQLESESLELSSNPFKNTSQSRLRERHLTIVQQTYLSGLDEEPTAHSASSSIPVSSQEQVYGPRKQTVGSDFKSLDLGWFKDSDEPIGVVLIENVEGTDLQTIPTPFEKAQIAGRILMVSLSDDGNCLLIHPGQTQAVLCQNPKALKIKCQSGNGRFKVTIFPG